jgi:TolA-binding protein
LLSAEVKSAEGAEAYYRVVEALYADGKYDEAEQMILKFAESRTPQNY